MSKHLSVLLLLLGAAASAAGDFYCCVDAVSGRRVCADSLPEQCRGRAYRVIDSSGNVVKEVGPPLSPEQKAEQAMESRRIKLLEAAAREQRRRDQALLDTYATPQDIDLAQGKAQNDVNLAMQDTQARIDAARKKRLKFEAEAEFYKKKAMPPELQKELRALDHEIKVQQELLDVKQHDLEAIKTKYDADRKRYFELTGRTPQAASRGAAPPPGGRR